MSLDWKAWLVPRYSTPEVVQRLVENFEFFDDDVLINTYAKSGTTLTQEIVYCLLHGVQAAKEINLWHRSPHLEWARPDPQSGQIPMDWAPSLPRPRVVKTHLPVAFHLRHLNREQNKSASPGAPRVIILMRNPKDTMASAFHHFTNSRLVANELPKNFSDMWKKLALECNTKDSSFFNYFDSTLSWWAMRDHPRVRVYFFEDLVTKKAEVVKSIAEFLGVEVTEDQVQAIVEHTSFDAMRGNSKANPSLQGGMQPNLMNGFNFIRKGQVGDWKNHFTVADNELMDRLIADKFDPVGLKFVYE